MNWDTALHKRPKQLAYATKKCCIPFPVIEDKMKSIMIEGIALLITCIGLLLFAVFFIYAFFVVWFTIIKEIIS